MVVDERSLVNGSDEARLVARMQSGDEQAFETLYGRHQPPVYRYALRMSGSPHVAEEVVQDVFLALIHGARGFDAGAGPLRSYLYGMARHALAKHWRAQRPHEDLSEDLPCAGAGPLDGAGREQSRALVWNALAALPEHYREAVVLCEMEEMTYEEAAEALGVAVGTIRSRLSRARQMLMERLSRQGVRA